jgi:hypothetical protein
VLRIRLFFDAVGSFCIFNVREFTGTFRHNLAHSGTWACAKLARMAHLGASACAPFDRMARVCM